MIDLSGRKWLKKDLKILIAFSGGIDSTVLTDLFLKIRDRYDLTLYAFHLDHQLRSSSKDDAIFVKRVCQRENIELFSYSLDIKNISKFNNKGVEITAREKRYELINKIVSDNGIDYVATAHHLDDNVETFLMRIFRGSGLKGLKCMSENSGNIIRPLINVSKELIEEYAEKNNIEYVQDETNFENDYFRNKIRNELIPIIKKEYSNNVLENINNIISAVRIEEDIVDNYYCSIFDFNKNEYELSGIRKKDYGFVKTFVVKLLENKFDLIDVNSYQINTLTDLILNSDSGYIVINSYKFSIESGYLVIIKNTLEKKDEKIKLKFGENHFGDYKIIVSKGEYLDNKNTISIPLNISNIYARTRENGDKFKPRGMSGTKKIKDFFVDKKIKKNIRDKVLLIADDFEIYWVYPYRKSNHINKKDEMYYNLTVYKIK